MKIVIVKKTGVLGELDWKKNVDLNSIYKKCGFRKNTDFEKRHTWKINNSEYISLYAKNNGRDNNNSNNMKRKDLAEGSNNKKSKKKRKKHKNNISDSRLESYGL